MDDEAFNQSIRKFLKLIGVSSQREIEKAVASALERKALAGHETLTATMTLRIPALELEVGFDGELKLE